MKNIGKLMAAVAASALIALALILAFLRSLYPDAMTITEISGDLVTIETATGNQFQFYGAEDYEEGDLVAVLMYSKGSESVTDDIIIRVRYAG